MLVSDALTLIAGHGGFDPSVAQTSDTMQRAWLNAAVQRAISKSLYLKQIRQLGPTVANQPDYAVDNDVIQVETVRVNGSRPWGRARLEDLWAAEGQPAAAQILGAPGFFAPSWETEAAQDVDDVPHNIRLYRAPTVSGQTIEAICSVMHKQITVATAANYALQLPEDLALEIAVDGAVAIGMLRVHERADLAAPYQARYDTAVADLKTRTNSRIGKGPFYARVRR